jgi:hypothetical protein
MSMLRFFTTCNKMANSLKLSVSVVIDDAEIVGAD